ncbi:hypothetical protein BKA63DRAFT_401978 [Paraphoma chrysanthemicola]|nr:hypothetical protein BKA63DRAFT_401978 [Paraphoma chrysanthemicola]
MAEPNAGLTADHDHRRSPASSVCYMAAEPAQGEQSAHSAQDEAQDGEATPCQSHPAALDENDSTPRSEVPSLPDAVTASLLSQMHPLAPEPSYFSPQPRRLYSSHIPRSTPASSEPSPTASTNASATSISFVEPTIAEGVEHSNATVRANSVDPVHAYVASSRQLRDGPVYPNQSYAALHLQQHPLPHVPPIVRSRSSHPAHSAANSLSSLASFGLNHEHYRDIMESAPRTVGNSPVSSPGLFDPNNRRSQPVEQPNDGLYSSPWLHHMHRQAPKETHIADVQADPVSGRKIVNQYEIIDELGRGMHGKVKLGKELNKGHYVAIKIVDRYSKRRRLGKSSSHEDKIKREIAILKKARHPNIVSLLEVIDDPAKRKVYIVLEHVELGEVKWRTEGAREICLVEWRRFKRESRGIFDNESAAMEDERIIRVAHQKLAREQRRRNREAHVRRQDHNSNEPWSFEFGGDSDDEYSEAGRSSRASNHDDDRRASRVHIHERQDVPASEANMETAFRTPTPAQEAQAVEFTGLEGTMYGAYENDILRLRTPSIAGSNSSFLSESEDDLPEHFRYVPLMTTQSAWEAFKDTVLGLEYLHYQNVYHRDIKPANLLVTREHRIKISDFGVSYLGRSKTDESAGDQSESEHQEEDEAVELAKTVGTPAFYAPELCRTDPDADTPKIDGGIDVWALGVTLYCLIYGRVPFHHDNPFTLMKVISEQEPYIPQYRLKPVAETSTSRPSSHGRNNQPMVSSKRAPHDLEYEDVDERLRDLLQKLLVKDSRHRITISEIKRHPWVLSGISNSNSWVEETDPGRSSQGRRIEISNEDLDKAVVPIGWVDRVRSTVKKGADFVTKSFARSSGSRRRAQSSVANQDANPSITKSIDRLVVGDDDAHGMPSLAVSTSNVSGHVDQPNALKELSPVARSHSPSPSEARSYVRSDTASRQSSLSSLSSRLHRNWAHANDLEVGPQLEIPSCHKQDQYLPLAAPVNTAAQAQRPSSLAREDSDVRFNKAKEELIRRKINEATMSRERPNSAANSRPSTAISQTACPPSPDDEVFFQRQKVEDYLSRHDPSSENSPVGAQERGLAFSSSEEQFTPMSQSTSNPSIPSVASAGSSAPDECAPSDNYQSMIPTASADSFHHNQFDAPVDDPAGYDGDHAVESDDDDSDDDGGLFIGKRKPTQSHRSESISIAEVQRSDVRKEVMHTRRRSARSGSNGTVKKIPPPGETTGDNTPELH